MLSMGRKSEKPKSGQHGYRTLLCRVSLVHGGGGGSQEGKGYVAIMPKFSLRIPNQAEACSDFLLVRSIGDLRGGKVM